MIGFSYRPKWRRDVLNSEAQADCIEIIAEHYLNASPEKLDELDQLAARCPLIPHGIGLSFGTDEALDSEKLRKVARLVEKLEPACFTEHIAFTHAHGRNIGHLAPVPFTRESVRAIARNVARWNDEVGVPLLLENISYLVALPGEMSEAEFLTEVACEAGCGLLLDLHNVHCNAMNHGYEAFEFLDSLLLERVGVVHLGGGHDEDGIRIDAHDSATPDAVWDLLRFVCSRVKPTVIVEWDTRLPPFETIAAEMGKARAIMNAAA